MPAISQLHSTHLREWSDKAFVLTPARPVLRWLSELDTRIARSPGFLASRAVILDLSAVVPAKDDIVQMLAGLEQRSIVLKGLTGVDASALEPELQPLLGLDHFTATAEMTTVAPPQLFQASASVPSPAKTAPPSPKSPASLVIEASVRSGQSIIFPDGDVTVLGSVGSGAEVMAGGSVHVYGTLRGRAMAGSGGNSRARIFCQKIEAELLAIDGWYRTADEIDESLRSRPAQAWLDGDTMVVTALN